MSRAYPINYTDEYHQYLKLSSPKYKHVRGYFEVESASSKIIYHSEKGSIGVLLILRELLKIHTIGFTG